MSFLQQALKTYWAIDSTLTPLDGELDLNLLAGPVDGKRYLVKFMRPDCSEDFVDMQCQALAHIHNVDSTVPVSVVFPSIAGQAYETILDESGLKRIIWVLEFIEGIVYNGFLPKSAELIHDLGQQAASLDKALQGFEHPSLDRDFPWNLMQAQWILDELECVGDPERVALLKTIVDEYALCRDALMWLPHVAVHNDINDYNILVQGKLGAAPRVAGLIDLGDMCKVPRICNLAVAGAYVVLDPLNAAQLNAAQPNAAQPNAAQLNAARPNAAQPDAAQPDAAQRLAALVAGYHSVQPLDEQELDMLLPLLRMRLAVSVVSSTLTSRKKPDDPYVVISQAPAWRFLDSHTDISHFRQRVRLACGYSVVAGGAAVMAFLDSMRGHFHPIMGRSIRDAQVVPLSIAESTAPQDPFRMTRAEAVELGIAGNKITLGAYDEPRLIYTDRAFRCGKYRASPRRTVHLGVDVFSAAGTSIHAPLDGVVVALENRTGELDYGGMLVVEHQSDTGETFYSLYGHLDPAVCDRLSVGQAIAAGDVMAVLGTPSNNGGWSPHLHLQLALSIDGIGSDWPGVADPDERSLWNALCPNAAALLNLADEHTAYLPVDEHAIKLRRKAHFSSNLKLSYEKPLMFLRGWKHYLIDQWGRVYLDAYNNVPHVGHAHPGIQAVVARQLARLNTNTRYLHPVQTEFAQCVVDTLPDGLDVCYFVNSGSEANELALRLARAATGAKDMITPDHGYHGNTTGAIDISAYKFNAPGGVGQCDWVHLVDIPDDYRGRFRRGECDTAESYAGQVLDTCNVIQARGDALAGFIAETFPSVGGQIIPPDGYLARVYEHVRNAGGICIADEVQTGLGRLGEFFYGFEQQGVVPDIVVLGKPLGNGHPMGAVITTRAIAEQFSQGPEFFSTFGGSTLSCSVGKAVLDIVRREGLQENAQMMGQRLIAGLRVLQKKHLVIGDVRGMGLFVGVELVSDRAQRCPASLLAAHVVNRLRDKRILTGLEGPDNNVLKIRPPLTIGAGNIDMIIEVLDEVLSESVLASQ